MSAAVLSFIVGLFVGASFGAVIMGFVVTTKHGGEDADNLD